jgi:hypothetical protein
MFAHTKHGPLGRLAFRRFWTAQTVSYLGDQVTIVALPLVAVLALDATAAEMGLRSTRARWSTAADGGAEQ